MEDSKILEYRRLFNEFFDWKDKMEELYNDPEFKRQQRLLEENEDHEWHGLVYGNLYDFIKEQSEI